MALSTTSICNMALARIGSKRINNLDTDTTPEAQWCREFYEPTRDALLRSHWWNFAAGRAVLVADTITPAFEWDYQFILPTDFLRMKSDYEGYEDSYTIEGKRLLTNDSEVSIRYVKKVTDVTQFDSLFVEILVLQLALKLIPCLCGTQSIQLSQDVKQDLMIATSKARCVNRNENNTTGNSDWNDARYNSGVA